MKQKTKFTYQDWWEGKIYFGGTIIHPKSANPIKPQLPIKFSSYQEVTEQDIIKIQRKQKQLFEQAVDDYLTKLIAGFEKSLKLSGNNEDLLFGTRSSLSTIFDDTLQLPQRYLTSKYLNKVFTVDAIYAYRNHYYTNILHGREHYNFIQSPKLKKSPFVEPSDEVIAEVYWRFKNYIDKNYPDTIFSKKSQDKVASSHFSICAWVTEKYSRREINTSLSNMLADMKDEKYQFISSQTSLKQFKSLFYGQRPPGKIIWTGKVAELTFFIKCLFKGIPEKQKQPILARPMHLWKIVLNYFSFQKAKTIKITSDSLRSSGFPKEKKREGKIVEAICSAF